MHSYRSRRSFVTTLASAAVATAALSRVADATPYASGVVEAAGTVSFTLNENASNVTIVRDGVSTTLGALNKGVQSFARNGATSYQIVVGKTAATGGFQDASGSLLASVSGQPAGTQTATIQQISDDANVAGRFNRPNGLAVNTNPSNGALFGRVYVTNGSAGAVNVLTITTPRTTSDGLYALNADLTDAIGQGDTARTGGIDFSVGTTSPWKLAIDGEGAVYVTEPLNAHAGVYRLDANLSNTSGTNLLVGTTGPAPAVPTTTLSHGSVYGAALVGSASGGNLTLYTIDEDLTPAGNATSGLDSLWRYDIGSTTSGYNGIPTQLATGLLFDNVNGIQTDLARGSDGKFYLGQYRAPTGGGESGLFVVAPDGLTSLFSSLAESTNTGVDADGNPENGVQDIYRGIRSIDVSPNRHYLAGMTNDSNVLLTPLIDGIPDIANRVYLDTFGDFTSAGWDVTFDAASNLYATATNGTAQAVRVFAPGAVSQTVYGSGGTFQTITEQSFNGSGNLADAGHWLQGSVASGADAVVSVGNLTVGTQTITSDAATSLSRLRFVGGNYTVSGSGIISLGTGLSEPRIIAEAGNQTISAPLMVGKNLGVAAYAGASLVLTNVSYAQLGTYTITKWADGKVTMPTFKQRKLDIKGGTLAFNTPATGDAAFVTVLQIAGAPAASTASLDLGASALVLDYSSTATSPLADVVARIKHAYTGGTWQGTGITSSAAAGDNRLAVGFAEISSFATPPSTFLNIPITDATELLLRVTFKGDSDLNGAVNFDDLLVLARNYNGTGKLWTDGDSDYNGAVDFDDLLGLARNYNRTLSAAQASTLGSAFTADFELARALVPEPSGLAVLGLSALGTRRRRR